MKQISYLAIAILGACGAIAGSPVINTSTALTNVSPAAGVAGQAITLSASVSPAAASGTVSFMDGGLLIGVAALHSGSAQLTTLTLGTGRHSIRAVYGGAGGYGASQSAALPYVVTAAVGAGFGTATTYPLGTSPEWFALGDFNGDGKLDAAAVNADDNTVSVLLGNGDGTFQARVNYATGTRPESVAIADFNGDGKPDLVVANIRDASMSLLLGNGNGTFQNAIGIQAANTGVVAVGDFNRDGRVDIATLSGNSLIVLLGNGDGTFQPGVSYAVIGPQLLAVDDFNGDGIPDLATANSNCVSNCPPWPSGGMTIFLGVGDGTFQQALGNFSLGMDPDGLVTGDINRDGIADLMVSNTLNSNVYVYLGNGDGSFQSPATISTGTRPRGLALGDINGDGKPDLLVSLQTPGQVSALTGNGDGTFQPAVNYSLGTNPIQVAAADLNGDGRLDIVAMGGITVLLANAPPATTTALTSNPNPSQFEQAVTLMATVTPASARGVIEFLDGTTILGSGLVNSAAPVTLVTPIGGFHEALRGRFAGSATGQPSLSNIVSQVVNSASSLGPGTATNYGTGSNPVQLATGDLNGDGFADVIAANTSSNNVSVLLGNGNGTLQTAVNYAAGTNPRGVAVGDLNGDGKLDVVVANETGSLVSVLLGNGDGTLKTAVNYKSGTGFSGPAGVAVADLNGDGIPDLVVANFFSGTVSALIGNGDGTFQAPLNFSAGSATSNPLFVAVGDFNGDGNADLAVANNSSGNVSILLGNGNGTFQSAVYYIAGTRPDSVAIGDFNGDGKLDLVVGNHDSTFLSVLLGNGDGSFQAAANCTVPTGTTSVAVGDLNGDGRADLIAVQDPVGAYGVMLLGNGNGTFQNAANLIGTFGSPLIESRAPRSLAGIQGPTPSAVIIGDFNRDGRTDLAVANLGTNTVSILLGVPAPSLTISKSHTGNFTQGQLNATYAVTVSNAAGAGSTSGTVTVTETVPPGETLVAMAGSGWTCPGGNTCTRSDALAAGESYSSITVTVNVAANAAASVTNQVSVTGGGSGSADASDPTVVNGLPTLTISKSHAGNFTQGQNGATYAVTVGNNGTGPTNGTVTVTEMAPAGETLVSMSGSGWTCPGGITCIRSDALAPGGHYASITVTVNLAGNAAASVTNQVSVSGGGSASANASDPTTIAPAGAPSLTISKSHSGNFAQGQNGVTYTVMVGNSGTASTNGAVTVTESVPAGETLVSMTGSGWTCPAGGVTCTRSDALASAASYPAITVTVNLASNAPPNVTNQVSVSGGGSASGSASDPATITAPNLTITKSHSGNFAQGQTGAIYTVTVGNSGTASTNGTVTVTESVPAGETLLSMAGAGWTCPAGTLTCTRGDALSPGESYGAITVTVNIASSAAASVTNQVSVSGGESASAAASDPTTITSVSGHPPFFNGEVALSNGVYYLQFPNNDVFGYYSYLGSGIIYHFDLGYEYIDSHSTQSSAFLYDFASGHWWYTTSGFPYLYDFTLSAWLYYFPDTKNAGRYTASPRYFVNLVTQVIFTM